MTEAELEELLTDCPTLYHMAEDGSWPSIRERGLLSTTALLDLYGVTGAARVEIEERRRPASLALHRSGLPRQWSETSCLWTMRGCVDVSRQHLAPADWYRLLNQKVFFWLTRDRLIRLLKAGTYRVGPIR